MGRPPKSAPVNPVRAALQRRVRDLEEQVAALQERNTELSERYKRLIDRTVELLFGDLKS